MHISLGLAKMKYQSALPPGGIKLKMNPNGKKFLVSHLPYDLIFLNVSSTPNTLPTYRCRQVIFSRTNVKRKNVNESVSSPAHVYLFRITPQRFFGEVIWFPLSFSMYQRNKVICKVEFKFGCRMKATRKHGNSIREGIPPARLT